MKNVPILVVALLLLSSLTIQAQSLSTQDKISLTELVARWNQYTDAPNLANGSLMLLRPTTQSKQL